MSYPTKDKYLAIEDAFRKITFSVDEGPEPRDRKRVPFGECAMIMSHPSVIEIDGSTFEIRARHRSEELSVAVFDETDRRVSPFYASTQTNRKDSEVIMDALVDMAQKEFETNASSWRLTDREPSDDYLEKLTRLCVTRID